MYDHKRHIWKTSERFGRQGKSLAAIMSVRWKKSTYEYRHRTPTKLQTATFTSVVLFLLYRSLWTSIPPAVEFPSPKHDSFGMNIKRMPRIKVTDNISYEEFFRMSRNNPVIVEGGVKHHPAFRMTFRDILSLTDPNVSIITKTNSDSALQIGGYLYL